MQLSTGQAHDLYIGLVTLEREESLKFTGEVRLKIAVNINLLSAHAQAYERARTRLAADLNRANRALEPVARRSDAELQADLADADAQMREVQIDLPIRPFTRPDLKLDENQKLGGQTLARILPILEGLEI